MSGAPAAARGGFTRRALLVVHRWLGLTLGLVLMSSGLTGALLVIAKPADRAWNAPLHHASGPGLDVAALDRAVQRIGEAHPGAERVVRLPLADGDSVRVDVHGAWDGEIFLDPASGAELGRRAAQDGFYNTLFEWHSALLSGTRGKAILALAAVAGVIAAVAGIALWWPQDAGWRRALRVQWRANLLRQVLDLHRVGGVVIAVLLVVSLGSGLYMAWRPVSGWVDGLGGHVAPPWPRATAGILAPVSRLVDAANAALPGGRVSIVVLPAPGGDRPVRVRKRLPDEVHPNGLSSVYLHPSSAAVLRLERWDRGGPGLLGYQYLYPLHAGRLAGPAHAVAVGITGSALFLLGASGLWLWWRRGRRVA